MAHINGEPNRTDLVPPRRRGLEATGALSYQYDRRIPGAIPPQHVTENDLDNDLHQWSPGL